MARDNRRRGGGTKLRADAAKLKPFDQAVIIEEASWRNADEA
jgi:hypothetical protein